MRLSNLIKNKNVLMRFIFGKFIKTIKRVWDINAKLYPVYQMFNETYETIYVIQIKKSNVLILFYPYVPYREKFYISTLDHILNAPLYDCDDEIKEVNTVMQKECLFACLLNAEREERINHENHNKG